MVAFFKSLEPLNRKIAEIQATPLTVRRKKRSTNSDEYWDAPDRKCCTVEIYDYVYT